MLLVHYYRKIQVCIYGINDNYFRRDMKRRETWVALNETNKAANIYFYGKANRAVNLMYTNCKALIMPYEI